MEPKFIDLGAVDCERVVYSTDATRKLAANLWAPITRTDEFRKRGLSLKQTVLLFGTFGTGKTLAGYKTGQLAIGNGWTAIYAESGDNLKELLQLAGLYAPAVVFCEDIDVVAAAGSDNIEAMLDAFDGVQAKGREVLVVLTTNNVGQLHAGMLRPGRIDVMVEIGHLDRESVEKVLRTHVPTGELGEVDFDVIFQTMDGFTPSFVAQVVERARKYALLDDQRCLTTDSILAAIYELQDQKTAQDAASTKPERPTLDGALGSLVSQQVQATLSNFKVAGRGGGQLVHQPSANGTKN
jgi:ATP-dependent 26S proteasome regulatory subunit